MKFGFIFSICALILIYFQLSAAVKCPGNKGECSSCVMYRCPNDQKSWNFTKGMSGEEQLRHVYWSEELGFPIDGCPDDFFKICSKRTEFIKSKNYNDMEFYDPKDDVFYISGCGNEQDGKECMEYKYKMIKKKSDLKKNSPAFCFEGGKPCVIPGDEPADYGSNDQNGALKLIGILSFGWLLSTVAWNLY